MKALRFELSKTHKVYVKGDVTMIDLLVAKSGLLRDLSMLHMESLVKFRRSAPHLDFPALHKELFSVDIWNREIYNIQKAYTLQEYIFFFKWTHSALFSYYNFVI